MESVFLFFLVGLSVFLIKHLVKNRSAGVQFLAYLGSGLFSGWVVGLAAGSALSAVAAIPREGAVVMGGLAGVILYAAERGGLLTRPGIRYFATILLGLVLAGLSYVMMVLYAGLGRGVAYRAPAGGARVPLTFVLVGFLTVFGYTFPERWFRQRRVTDTEEMD